MERNYHAQGFRECNSLLVGLIGSHGSPQDSAPIIKSLSVEFHRCWRKLQVKGKIIEHKGRNRKQIEGGSESANLLSAAGGSCFFHVQKSSCPFPTLLNSSYPQK